METQLLAMYLIMLVVALIGLCAGGFVGAMLLRHANEIKVLIAFVLMLAIWSISQVAHSALGAFEASNYTIALIGGFLVGGLYRVINRRDSAA